jgi:MFS family permease
MLPESGAKSFSGFARSWPAWCTCLCASLFFMFEFMQLNAFNALDPVLMKYFKIGAANIGNLSAFYFYAVVACLFPAGILLDKFSTRKIILIGMCLCVSCVLLFSQVTLLWQAEVLRFLTGVAGSVCMLSCVRLASRWFPPQRLAFVIGVVVTMAMFGGFMAQTVLTPLIDKVGWRNTFIIDAIFGALLLAVIFYGVTDFPPNSPAIKNQAEKFKLSHCITCSLRNPQNWFAGAYAALLNLPIFLLGAMWGSLYLVQVRGLDRATSAWIVGMLFIGSLVGAPLIGKISDLIERRRICMIVSSLIALVLIFVLMLAPALSISELVIIFFLLGVITSAQVLSYPVVVESNPAQYVGAAEGVACILIMSGGFFQPVFGWLMDLHWAHKFVNGTPLYSHANFQLAFWLMPAAFVVSFFCALLLREKAGDSAIEQITVNHLATSEETVSWQ